ncbi:sigma-70 family RNA polymerase sigma factor [Rossellomorea vietnamensis]|uniref:Sigma-70 family RNA polymerase sigma factor n=1 Tax=Rossellomorea vietnamensis TaxID=218284 RepID=A0A5D4M2A8_9BACI|nr:sigma-70 family RNA polymerase sigma factor [Rossellomorea vietnamensis]TYR95702.1 sigma-70 family RNA polymerase sigma factor [Rossellomorea vietnamensis]
MAKKEFYLKIDKLAIEAKKDNFAKEELYKELEGTIKGMLFNKGYFIPGMDDDDALQIATIGFLKALSYYDPTRGPFVPHMMANIHSAFIIEMNKAQSTKHVLNHMAYSMNNRVSSSSDDEFSMFVADDSLSPEEKLYIQEDIRMVWDYVESCDEETQKIFRFYYIDGLPMKDVANVLGIKRKRVDNVITRIKRNLKNNKIFQDSF